MEHWVIDTYKYYSATCQICKEEVPVVYRNLHDQGKMTEGEWQIGDFIYLCEDCFEGL